MSPDKEMLDALRIDRAGVRQSRPFGALAVAALLIVAVASGVFWWLNRPRAVEIRSLVVEQAVSGAEAERTLLNASGYVTARREATVSSKVTGKVVEVFVEEGKEVEAGQVLSPDRFIERGKKFAVGGSPARVGPQGFG